MKIGMRKPSIKKSISARTTGRAKRAVKKAVIPGYGKKGSGWIKNPKKAAYNKVYNKTTFSVTDIAKTASSSRSKKTSDASYNNIVPKDIVICPNCGQPLKKSEVSEYYLCDNCKIRIQPDNVQLSSASKPKKKKQGKAGCFGWFCSIMLNYWIVITISNTTIYCIKKAFQIILIIIYKIKSVSIYIGKRHSCIVKTARRYQHQTASHRFSVQARGRYIHSEQIYCITNLRHLYRRYFCTNF